MTTAAPPASPSTVNQRLRSGEAGRLPLSLTTQSRRRLRSAASVAPTETAARRRIEGERKQLRHGGVTLAPTLDLDTDAGRVRLHRQLLDADAHVDDARIGQA